MPTGQFTIADLAGPPPAPTPTSHRGQYTLADLEGGGQQDSGGPSIAADAVKYSPLGMVKGLADMITTAASGKNPLAGVADANEQLLEKAKASFGQGHYADATGHFINYLIPGGSAFEDIQDDLRNGNYGHAAAKFGGLASSIVLPEKAPAIVAGVKSGAAKVGDVVNAATKVDAPTAIIKALKPSSANADFVETLPKALGDIKAAEPQTGPITSNETLIPAARAALDKNREAMNVWEAVPTSMNTQVHGAPIAQAMTNAAGDMMKLEDPAGYAAVADRAEAYNRPFSLPELKSLLQEGNKRLNAFYNAAPDRQAAQLGAGLNPAVEEAKLSTIRDLYYKALDPENEGAGPRDIQQRYGAAADLLNTAMHRRNAILGEQDLSPWERFKEDLKGTTQLTRLEGHLAPAASNSDELIQKAFQAVEPGGVHPVPADTPIPRGRLGAPAIATPPPADTSFVRGVPAMTQPPNPALALEAGKPPIVTPPPAETSGLQVFDAARQIARDPKTGRMFRYYTSGRAPRPLSDLEMKTVAK